MSQKTRAFCPDIVPVNHSAEAPLDWAARTAGQSRATPPPATFSPASGGNSGHRFGSLRIVSSDARPEHAIQRKEGDGDETARNNGPLVPKVPNYPEPAREPGPAVPGMTPGAAVQGSLRGDYGIVMGDQLPNGQRRNLRTLGDGTPNDQFDPGQQEDHIPEIGVGPTWLKRWVGATTSYGCYAGPGGLDESGSRCGLGAPAVDAVDEQGRQHDMNYFRAGVTSATPKPGSGQVNMFSLDGFVRTEDADTRLAGGVRSALQANPDFYAPSAHLYGTALQGVFGGRAGIAGGIRWGREKHADLQTGMAEAQSARNWAGRRSGEAITGVTGAASDAGTFASARGGQAIAGVTNAASDAAHWGADRVNEAHAGTRDFVRRAASSRSVGEALENVGTGAQSALHWGRGAARQAVSGTLGAVNNAGAWVSDTGRAAVRGVAQSGRDAARWGGKVAGEVGEGAKRVHQGLRWAGSTAREAAGGVRRAAGAATRWAGEMGTAGARYVATEARREAGNLIHAGRERVGRAWTGARQMASQATETARGAVNNVAETVSNTAHRAWNGAGQMASGAVQGVTNTASRAYNAVSDWWYGK